MTLPDRRADGPHDRLAQANALAAELFAVLNDGTPRAMVIAVMSGVAVTFTAGVTAFVLTRRARRSGDL